MKLAPYDVTNSIYSDVIFLYKINKRRRYKKNYKPQSI